jgi:DNA-binding SARP family transcriptional activator
MEFRILGPLEVIEDDQSLPLGGARPRALLALLLTRPNQVVSTDRLVDQLWGASPPKTALNTLQHHVSQLRKLLGPDRIVTRPPGYEILVRPGELDLERFEALLAQDDAVALREALALWRGPALADLAVESFAQAETARLEELRLAALERRLELDLEEGRDAELVGELEGLIAEHPLRERLCGQLMLALYRSGRQAEALEAYQATRRTLLDELGIDPSSDLQKLERAILNQDPALGLAPLAACDRSILVGVRNKGSLASLLALAELLAKRPPKELILAQPIGADGDLARATAGLNNGREELRSRGVSARAAAFVSSTPGDDLIRVAVEQDVDLLLLDGTATLFEDQELVKVLSGAPCDVAILVGRGPRPGPVLVPFVGVAHDWAAVELGAWIAGAAGVTLQLAGTAAEPADGRRDASRLLASASLVVQRALGVAAEPMLVPVGGDGLAAAAREAGLVVVGLSDRWSKVGLGTARLALAESRQPVLLVRRGLRPGGLAPRHSLTRFTWTLVPGGV